MRFWDTSALIPLIIAEPRSGDVRQLLREDSEIFAAAVAAVEVTSAIWRRKHAGELSIEAMHDAERSFALISRRWTSIFQSQKVVDLAIDLLTRHKLRSLDAIQLATALSIAEENRPFAFVTLDRKLALAAQAEGFPTLP